MDCDNISLAPTLKENNVKPAIEQELAELRGEYFVHQVRLNRLENSRSDKKLAGREVMMLRAYWDRYNRPYFWVFGRERCTARGGCCGRTCDCCKKALVKYLEAASEEKQQTDKERRESGVFGWTLHGRVCLLC